MLELAGVSFVEERVYRHLVAVGSAPASVISQRLGIPSEQVRATLENLEVKGLVSRTSGPHPSFIPAPPDLALEPLILQRQHQLQQTRATLEQLAEEYRSAQRRTARPLLVDVVVGADAIDLRWEQLQRSARHEFLTFVKPPQRGRPRPADLAGQGPLPPGPATPGQSTSGSTGHGPSGHGPTGYGATGHGPSGHGLGHGPTGQVLTAQVPAARTPVAYDRGVSYRAIYDRSFLDWPEGLRHVELLVQRGDQIRVLDSVPMRLAVADRSVALVPLATIAEEDPCAILVRPNGLLDTVIALFETLWSLATPVLLDEPFRGESHGEGVRLSAEDVRLLSLMRAGLTDEAIAKQLGTSKRTVLRRVRRLMDLTQTETRFQLGCEAAQRSWL